jgi:hypothetical protein
MLHRQRRVKCDETKPGCIRCQNLGRECGGYTPEAPDDASMNITPVAIHPRPMSGLPYSPSVAIPGDQQERRYFQRFCDKTAAEICGSFDPTFWTEKVLQLCHQDAPAIRYATIALGALAKSLEVSSFPTRLSLSGFPQIDHHHLDEHHRYALRQYSRAIASLRAILSDGRRHLRTSLTCCVLFMSFEALQGSYDGSLTHLRGGSRLLADWRMARRGQASRLSQDSLSEIQDGLVDDLGRMFARLDVQGLFVPPPFQITLQWEDVVVCETFDSTAEARESWDFLFCGIAQFYRQSVTHSQQNPEEIATTAWMQRHDHYMAQLLQWRSAFQGAHAEEVKSGTIKTEKSAMLSIYYNLATILLASSIPHSEMMYDNYTNLFSEIITKVNHLLSSTEDPSNTSRFTLEMGTILPLYITVTKCRDRRIRRQAIALLWSNARREGLCFDTITIARLCAWLTSIEGEGSQDDIGPIPESSRNLITYLHLSSEQRWLAVQLTSALTNDNGSHVYRETTFSW